MKGANLKSQVKTSIETILTYIGENPKREGLNETPDRMIKSWDELFSGYKTDPETLFKTFESEHYDGMILLKDIEYYSTCEHHFLSFSGVAHVAYIPNDKIIGISKLARLVDIYSRRLQTQERLTIQVVETLSKYLNPKGAAAIFEGEHTCLACRGIKKRSARMITSALRGSFLKKTTRSEFMNLAMATYSTR